MLHYTKVRNQNIFIVFKPSSFKDIRVQSQFFVFFCGKINSIREMTISQNNVCCKTKFENKLQAFYFRSSNNVTDTDWRILCSLCTVDIDCTHSDCVTKTTIHQLECLLGYSLGFAKQTV